MKRFLCAALLAAFALSAGADGFFEGKRITYIIATKPGGNYDAYGRLIGRYLEIELGADRVTFKNLPGAGHIIGANTLFASKPDGLTIGTFNTGLIYAQILQREGISFDLNEFSWIGKAAADARAIVLSNNSGMTSFEDLAAKTETVLFAASGIGSAAFTETKMLADALDLNIEVIPGYQGNEGEMAMLRGEVVGKVGSLGSLQPFIDAGNGFMALAIGGDVQPQAIDYATSDKGKSIVNLIDAMSNLGRLTAAPPGVPEDVLEELRNAYMAVMVNLDFLADTVRLGLSIEPARGDQVADMVHAALQQSPNTVAIISAALNVEIPTIRAPSDILSLADRNKEVGFNSGDQVVVGSVSGSRTDLMINGEKAERDGLAVGMMCEFEYDPAHETNEFKSVSCSGADAAAAQPETAVMTTVSAILSLEDSNKIVEFNSGGAVVKAKISGSRTAITIDGAEADRKALSVGMTCDIEYDSADDENEPSMMVCTN
ncbi:MAG: Bug family tripartite tricarboxylate transporter substrate binding protein [Paracoccaceae bacterium]